VTSGSTGNRDVVGFVVWILGLVVVIILVEIPIGLVTSPLLLRSGVPPSGDEIGRGTAHITSCRAEPPVFLPTYECAARYGWRRLEGHGRCFPWLDSTLDTTTTTVSSTRPLNGDVPVLAWCKVLKYGRTISIRPTDQVRHPERGWWVEPLGFLSMLGGFVVGLGIYGGASLAIRRLARALRRAG